MLKEELINSNPLRSLCSTEKAVYDRRVGLVMARAGVGKTSLLVQIALDNMLRGRNILHVSIGQSLDKTKIWYEDIFNHIVEGHDPHDIASIREDMIRRRMIMTFNADIFSVSKLEERLRDLVDQHIFHPDCVLVDGFDCALTDKKELNAIRQLMVDMDMNVWITSRSHRDDQRVSKSGVPAPCHELDSLFDTVIVLEPKPEEKSIALKLIKDTADISSLTAHINLDPATLMLKKG